MKRSPITPKEAAKRLAEIAETKATLKRARRESRAAKSAANKKTHKAPPMTEHTGKKRRLIQVCYVILGESELGMQPSGDPTELGNLEGGDPTQMGDLEVGH